MTSTKTFGMIEKPKFPENRVTCGYCGATRPQSKHDAHFCAKHPKLMKVLLNVFCTAAAISIVGLACAVGILLRQS